VTFGLRWHLEGLAATYILEGLAATYIKDSTGV